MYYVKQVFRKFRANEKGAVAIELIFIMPFMILWIVGSIAFFDAFKTYLTSNKATYTVIDLVSRLGGAPNTVTDQQIELMGQVFDNIVDADGAQPQVIISSIIKDGEGGYDVAWSVGTNGAIKLKAEDIPEEYIPIFPDDDSILLIQSHVPFLARKVWGGLTNRTFSNTLAVTPRYTNKILNSDQPEDGGGASAETG